MRARLLLARVRVRVYLLPRRFDRAREERFSFRVRFARAREMNSVVM
jgi:hypothetical protein